MGKPDDLQVAILLATYNGEKYLDEQVISIANQGIAQIDIWASDDGSVDATTEKLRGHAETWSRGKFEVLDGPRAGFAENFRSLLVNSAIDANFFAYADQDDVWDADKLERAIAWLGDTSDARPKLYCGRTRTMTQTGAIVGSSPLFRRPPSFANAIVQSIAGGNTMVFNRAARDLLVRASADQVLFTHDWWTYQVVSGAGGEVFYDPDPSVSYRQHASNVVGENNSWRARFNRIGRLFAGQMVNWNSRNIAGFDHCIDLFTGCSRDCISAFRNARNGNIFARLANLRRSGVYRQTALGNVGLIVACIVKKL